MMFSYYYMLWHSCKNPLKRGNKYNKTIPKLTCIPPQLAARLLLLPAESQSQANSKADLL